MKTKIITKPQKIIHNKKTYSQKEIALAQQIAKVQKCSVEDALEFLSLQGSWSNDRDFSKRWNEIQKHWNEWTNETL